MTQEKKFWKWKEKDTTVVRSIARTGPGCHNGCGVHLYVKDGKLIKVEGNPAFPYNQGRLCPRCLVLPQVVYNPGRLKYPLKRAGKRGENKWNRITWNEALDIITKKFIEIRKDHGPESVLFCTGTARDIPYWIERLAGTYGSPNNICWGPLYGAACFHPRVALHRIAIGGNPVADCSQFFANRYDNPDWKVPECIVIWGSNPIISSPDGIMGPWITECMKRRTELIVIDPRKTWFASRAKIWLQIRPGTDAALVLSMLNVIINENLYDQEFVDKWTYGFDKLQERVQEYPPERAAEITGVPGEQIIKAARFYAKSRPAAVQTGVAVDQSKECIATIHGILALFSITGNVDVPGGNVILNTEVGMRLTTPEMQGRRDKVMPSPFPLKPHAGQHVIDQVLSEEPYPIKASWIQGTNTFVTEADPHRVYKAFQKIGFNVVVDLFMTPSALAFADIVLPAVTYAEKDGLTLFPPLYPYLGAINKAIEPVGEAKSDTEINFALGKRLNPEAWAWKDIYGWFDAILEPNSVTFEELREKGWIYGDLEYQKYEKGLLRKDKMKGFETPTGKIELYSTALDDVGVEPLPFFEEPPESPVSTPEIAEEYPLILSTGAKVYSYFHSEHRQIPMLRSMNPDPLVEIHPDTAEEIGVKDGDWVYIENRYGRCKEKAKLTTEVLKGVVHAQHGWWFPEKSDRDLFGAWESNVGQLIPAGWTGSTGYGYPFKNLMCKVYKVA